MCMLAPALFDGMLLGIERPCHQVLGLFLGSSAAALSLGLMCLCPILSQYVDRLKMWSWQYMGTHLHRA